MLTGVSADSSMTPPCAMRNSGSPAAVAVCPMTAEEEYTMPASGAVTAMSDPALVDSLGGFRRANT